MVVAIATKPHIETVTAGESKRRVLVSDRPKTRTLQLDQRVVNVNHGECVADPYPTIPSFKPGAITISMLLIKLYLGEVNLAGAGIKSDLRTISLRSVQITA
jgi:hypothetical protein